MHTHALLYQNPPLVGPHSNAAHGSHLKPAPSFCLPAAIMEIRPSHYQEYRRHSLSRSTTPASTSSNESSASRSETRANEGLSIQMRELNTPNSPDSVYRLKGGLYSPISPQAPVYKSGTVSTSLSRARTDPMTQRLIEHRATQATRWTIHWRTPFLMISSFLVGIALAFGQHRLYSSLHHRVEEDEGKKVRYVLYGRAVAYFAKVAFGMCCILVYRQRIW
jgi:hypothetical protein